MIHLYPVVPDLLETRQDIRETAIELNERGSATVSLSRAIDELTVLVRHPMYRRWPKALRQYHEVNAACYGRQPKPSLETITAMAHERHRARKEQAGAV